MVVRSESQVYVGNAVNLKKSSPCKTGGCDKNIVVRKYFLSNIVVEPLLCLMKSYIHSSIRVNECEDLLYYNPCAAGG